METNLRKTCRGYSVVINPNLIPVGDNPSVAKKKKKQHPRAFWVIEGQLKNAPLRKDGTPAKSTGTIAGDSWHSLEACLCLVAATLDGPTFPQIEPRSGLGAGI